MLFTVAETILYILFNRSDGCFTLRIQSIKQLEIPLIYEHLLNIEATLSDFSCLHYLEQGSLDERGTIKEQLKKKAATEKDEF